MMAFVSGLKSYASLAARRVPPAARAIETSEALRINYVYLIVKNMFFTQKTFGSLVARAIECPTRGHQRDEWGTPKSRKDFEWRRHTVNIKKNLFI